ncbi:MAG: hypothetical protein NTY37_04780 [Methanothrix sp.]|nr:hypothetical protein [Methanothrix sp.]
MQKGVFTEIIAPILIFGLLIFGTMPAIAQPICGIQYMVVPVDQIVAGPLVAPGYYDIWFGLSSNNQWTTAGPFMLSGGHKYLVSPDMTLASHVWEDHIDISSYPFPTSDVAAVYYRQWDEHSRSYKITVCP